MANLKDEARDQASGGVPLELHQALVEGAVNSIALTFAKNGLDGADTACAMVGASIALAVEEMGLAATVAELKRCAEHLEIQERTLDGKNRIHLHS